MSKVRSTNTNPELIVRRLTHAMGYRYRLHRKNLPGKPDLVFPGKHKVIFIHGCFWHRHDDPACRLTRLPKSHLDFWVSKFEKNKKRDADTQEKLESMGWSVMTIWECQLREPEALALRIREFLDS